MILLPNHEILHDHFAYLAHGYVIFKEVLREYPGVLWLDSSVCVTSSNLSSVLSHAVHISEGAALLSGTGHSNYAVTHPDMYAYLPSDVNQLRRTQQWEANSMLLYRTRWIYRSVLRWWYLCALTERCIAPTLHRFCTFDKHDQYTWFASCHRFDQSAINILLANAFDYRDATYYSRQHFIKIDRQKNRSNKSPAEICG